MKSKLLTENKRSYSFRIKERILANKYILVGIKDNRKQFEIIFTYADSTQGVLCKAIYHFYGIGNLAIHTVTSCRGYGYDMKSANVEQFIADADIVEILNEVFGFDIRTDDNRHGNEWRYLLDKADNAGYTLIELA